MSVGGSALAAAPTPRGQRLGSLDTVRGVALLGILPMNIVLFGLSPAGYHNATLSGALDTFDTGAALAAEVLVDMKMMGLFSLLFGVGVVLFAENIETRGGVAAWPTYWRNLLLLLIGIVHRILWSGDILIVYAVLAPVVLGLRRVPARRLAAIGTVLVLAVVPWAVLTQLSLQDPLTDLGYVWTPDGGEPAEAVTLYLSGEQFLRSLGFMLLGVALFREGVFAGGRDAVQRRRVLVRGLAVGLPVAVLGAGWHAAGVGADRALVAEAVNVVAAVPMTLAYLAALLAWDERGRASLRARLRAVGRMALSNYLAQTLIGTTVVYALIRVLDWGRAEAWAAILAIWALQLWWSPRWLATHPFGPAERWWRMATYRRRSAGDRRSS